MFSPACGQGRFFVFLSYAKIVFSKNMPDKKLELETFPIEFQ